MTSSMNVVGFLSRAGKGATRSMGSRNGRETWRRAVVLSLMLLFAGASTAETVTYYYTNQQGTPLATADASGTILTTSYYRPYGSQVLGSPVGGPGYTGHVNDPDSGLVYMQARYYDPVVGRFLGVDAAGIEPGEVFRFGRFNYASGNPNSNVDPDGRQDVPLSAYTAYWPGTEQQKLHDFAAGMTGTLVSIATGSNVFDVAPAGSGSGAVASSGLPGEFLAASALTRGASALSMLAATSETSEAGQASTLVPTMTSVNELRPTHGLTMTKNELNSLADDIRANGVQEPLVVTKDSGSTYVLDGHHRVTAARMAGLEEVPTIETKLPYGLYDSPSDLDYLR